MKDENKKDRNRRLYYETAGARMTVNALGLLGLYVIGGIAYTAGKKVLATFALGGMLGLVIMQAIDGTIVQKHNNK